MCDCGVCVSFLCIFNVECFESVSYTHLDVYKRQLYGTPALSKVLKNLFQLTFDKSTKKLKLLCVSHLFYYCLS